MYKGSDKINVVKQANGQVTQVHLSKIVWTPRNVQLYKNAADFALSNIRVPSCCISCQGVCLVTMHREQLNTLCSDITSALLSAVDCCETSRTVRNVAWFDELLQFRKDSPEAHCIWVSAGRPRVRGKCMTVGLLQELVISELFVLHTLCMNEKLMIVCSTV